MPTGIDVGPRAIHVATPDGVTVYGNGIRRADEDTDGDKDGGGDGDGDGDEGARLEIETDDGAYVVDRGAAVPDESLARLFGPGGGVPASVRTAVAESFLERAADAPGDALRYVAGRDGADPLGTVATGAGYDSAALDPGMAVCYDALDAPATGLGVAVASDRAVATLAVAGVPVATATVDLDDWYDLESTAEGPTTDWLARQYETLFADLGVGLAASAPALADPVSVAVGGTAAPPEDIAGRLDTALTAGLPFDVGGVLVVDDPGASPARGALAAATADDGTAPPLPAFAVDVPYAAALADFGAATTALGAAARSAGPADPADAGSTETGVHPAGTEHGFAARGTSDGDLEGVVARTREDLAALDRRGSMTARGLSDLVDRLNSGGVGGADSEAVAALRAELEDLESRLPDDGTLDSFEGDLAAELATLRESVAAVESDLEQLEETAATAETVADLESSVASLDDATTALEDDVDSVRAAVTGLEDGEEGVAGEALEGLAVDALQEDVEAVRSDVADRMDDVWSAVDDLEARLVDVEATAGDVPDLESTVGSVRNRVADLEDETADVRASLDSLASDLETVDEESPSTEDVDALRADLNRLADDVDALQTDLDETEWVDPEAVDQLETDLEGLRQTLIRRADRLDSLEETTEELRERIETVYGNSAKSEALASLESETARVRNTAAKAMERTNEMTETVSDLRETVDEHADQLGMVSTNVDNLAGSSVTRAEMESSIADVEERLDQLESDIRADIDGVRSLADQESDVEPVDEGTSDLVVGLQAAAFVFLGLLGALLALLSSVPFNAVIAAGFVMFAILPAVLAWLVN